MGKVIAWSLVIIFIIASILGAKTVDVPTAKLSSKDVQMNIQIEKEIDSKSFSR